ncbi:glycosyltransferase [Elioraea rosea]|uniref:glycosyltransferase n=1 Tax=Elioraea rosea TaxID=2492390 RepID=UPI001184D46F|nr:glycosyltransferase [Elioraea rosea]
MTRVAMVMAGARHGGAETFFVRLVLALASAGEEVMAAIRHDAAREAALEAAHVPVHGLAFGGPLDLLTRPRLGAALRRFAPRVVVSWMNRAAGKTPSGPWVQVGRLGGYYDLRHYRRCHHLVGNTEGIVRYIVSEGWPAERAHWLPNFTPELSGSAPIPRASLGVPESAPVLLAMGRLHRNKGFDTLIEALASLPAAHLAIAGEGPERAALEAAASRHGVASRVHLLGWRDDQAALLAACDVFVCSSRHEPLGNIVLEAWSAGRPVVAAASQGPSELIADGMDGMLVPAENAQALADAIASLLDDPARAAALAEAGRRAWQHRFAPAPVIARWRSFLATVER